jgi:hypothetical protein
LQLHCRYCRRPWLRTVARAGVRLSRDFSALLSMGDENMQTSIGRRDENLSTAAEAATTTATEGTVMQTVDESVQDATNTGRGENHPTVD